MDPKLSNTVQSSNGNGVLDSLYAGKVFMPLLSSADSSLKNLSGTPSVSNSLDLDQAQRL